MIDADKTKTQSTCSLNVINTHTLYGNIWRESYIQSIDHKSPEIKADNRRYAKNHSIPNHVSPKVYANRMKEHKPIMNEHRVQIHLVNYLERAIKDANLLESMKTEAINII